MHNFFNLKKLFTLVTVVVTLLLIVFVVYGFKLGIFHDKDILIDYMKKFGIFAPLFFVCLQIFQVVFPVIPGGASCLAGVMAFGGVMGFIYNYIGLVIGSIIAYYLSRMFGLPLIKKLFKEETVNKYLKYIKTDTFNKIFILGIFLPGLPDDLLCYIAGFSKMNFKMFVIVILLGKPLTLLGYSIFIYLL